MTAQTQVPPQAPVLPEPDIEFRIELAIIIAKIVSEVATERGLDRAGEHPIKAAITHKLLLHRKFRAPAEALRTAAVEDRLARFAGRLVNRELRRRTKERVSEYGLEPLDDEDCRRILKKEPHPAKGIELNTLVTLWMTLTLAEDRVLRLAGLKLDPLTISRILGTSIEEVETLKRQGEEKIHLAYRTLC